MPAFLDTNVLVHYLTRDDPQKASRCLGLLARTERREIELFTTDLVIAEAVWFLEKKIGIPRPDVRGLLEAVIGLPGLRMPNKQQWTRVFDMYCETRVDFIDAYNAVQMQRAGIHEIYSYDRDFDRIEGVERITP